MCVCVWLWAVYMCGIYMYLDGAHDEEREGRHHAGDDEERVGAEVREDERGDGVPAHSWMDSLGRVV